MHRLIRYLLSFIKQDSSYIFGQNIGAETLTREYKSFNLAKHIRSTGLSPQDAKQIVSLSPDSTLLHDFVRDSIHIYIKEYIPRYASVFGNTELDTNAELYLGIEDSGSVRGIPIIDSLSTPQQVRTIIDKYLPDNIKKLVKVELIPVYTETDDYIDSRKKIQNIVTKYNNYYLLKKQTKDQQKKWVKSVEDNRKPINVMVNDINIRIRLIKYIRESPNGTKQIKKNIIKQLESFKVFHYKEGEISKTKHDINTVAHWITQYRDDMSIELLRNRPVMYSFKDLMDPYIKIVIEKFDLLIPTMIRNNWNFYVVKITFPTKNFIPNYKPIEYDGKIYKRTMFMGTPCCSFT